MKNGVAKTPFLIIICVIVSITLVMGYETCLAFEEEKSTSAEQSAELLGQKSLDILAAQLQEANIKLDALNYANYFLEKQIEDLNASRKSLEDNLTKLNKKALEQEEANAASKKDLDYLKTALVKKKAEALALGGELNNAGAQKKSLELELLDIKAALVLKERELNKKALEQEEANAASKKDLDSFKTALVRLALGGELNNAGAQSKSLELELSSIKVALALKEQELKQKAFDQEEARVVLQKELDALKTALTGKEKEALALKEESNNAGAQKKSLESELFNIKSALALKEQELKQKTQDFKNVKKLYNSLKVQLPIISKLLPEKKIELADSERKLNSSKAELASKDRENKTLQSQLQAARKDASNLQSKYQDLQIELILARKQYKMADELNKTKMVLMSPENKK